MTLAHLLLLLENSLHGKEDDQRELIWEMQSEPGAALTEPENKISQHHVGSRAEAENFIPARMCSNAICLSVGLSTSHSLILFKNLIKRDSSCYHFCCLILVNTCPLQIVDSFPFSAECMEEIIENTNVTIIAIFPHLTPVT